MSRIDLTQKFPNLKLGKSAPALFRLNGCGVGMYGSRDHDAETGTYVATWCISLVFIPVLCLRAYRVKRAPQGWYFIGREPLSALAKGFNTLLLAAVLATVGVVQYNAYTSTPAYRAKQQMVAAHDLAGKGQLAQAARIYQMLVTSGTEQANNATLAVKGLMDNECAKAPLGESAGVIASAAQIARRGQIIPVSEVAAKGMTLVAEKGDTDPRSGVAILDAIRPLVIDTRPIDTRRLALLRKWAALEPTNLEVITPLASLLEQQDKLDEARKLLMPVKDKLGDGEGARVLGTILGREGDYDGAYTQLWPYVKSRLDTLHAAEKTSEDVVKNIWDREVKLLDEQKGPADFYTRYNAAGKDEQQAIVREYMNGQVKNDPQFTSAQEALERETAVVPVALELGIVMLQRAQGQSDPAIRKTQLESAEQIFLAIGGVAGQTDEYRLSLGQVYYWLGKQAEGHKLFDDYLTAKGRGFIDLLQIASRLRHLGAIPEARTMAEEAYNKGSKPEEQHQAAGFRALCEKDSDDKIAWLNKANIADPSIKATLAKALGDKAMEEGHDDEAGRQYQSAIDAYSAMPRSSSTVNETALAYYGIFAATGDHAALERCIDYFQQAVGLDPSNPILLFNAGVTLLDGAVADIIGTEIDLRALHESGNIGLLSYMYQDQSGRDALAERVKDHPGIARALSYLEKVMVLSPKDERVCSAIYGVHRFTHNEAALQTMEQRIRAAGLDTSDQLAHNKDFIAGVKDQQSRTSLGAALKRSEDRNSVLRAKGGRTTAVALDERVELMLNLDLFTGTVDTGKAVALAQEAFTLSPSSNTRTTLTTAHLFQAAKELRHADPAFDAFCKKYDRSVGISALMAVVASEPGPFQEKLLQNSEFQKAVALVREEASLYPEGHSGFDWALLKNADPGTAEKSAAYVRTIPRKQVEYAISLLLRPAGASEALETYWLMQILGKPDVGREALKKVAGMGIPLPIQP